MYKVKLPWLIAFCYLTFEKFDASTIRSKMPN